MSATHAHAAIWRRALAAGARPRRNDRTERRRAAGRAPEGSRGAALLELAVVTPLLMVVVLGAVDFGRYSYFGEAVSNAAHAGAVYGTQSTDRAGDLAGIERAVRDDLSSTADDTAVVSVERFCTCPYSETRVACDATSCQGGASGWVPWMYVNVRVSASFEPLVPYVGMPQSLALVRVAEMRAR